MAKNFITLQGIFFAILVLILGFLAIISTTFGFALGLNLFINLGAVLFAIVSIFIAITQLVGGLN